MTYNIHLASEETRPRGCWLEAASRAFFAVRAFVILWRRHELFVWLFLAEGLKDR